MVNAKVLRINGGTHAEIDETAALLQDFLNKVHPADLKRLLTAATKNPGLVKKAIMFL